MEAKTIQKYKKKSTSALKKRAIFWFHKFIRLRDCDENGYANCISSGVPLIYGNDNCQAGHFYSGGKYETLRFNENNVNIQCKSDNYYNSGNENEYRKALIRKIGKEEVENLDLISDQDKRTSHKYDRFFFIELIEKYKTRCKELGENKNFKI